MLLDKDPIKRPSIKVLMEDIWFIEKDNNEHTLLRQIQKDNKSGDSDLNIFKIYSSNK